MKRKPRSKVDPIERQIELALCPGVFVHDRRCFSFVGDLEQVAASIGKVVQADPERGAGLYETFLAGCHEKAEELDDSSGSFGMFAKDLICNWIKARQSAGAHADDTASTLLAWMENDPHAFCYDIEKDTAVAFDRAGRAAFEKLIRSRFEAAAPGGQTGYLRRRWSKVLRAIYVAQRDVTAYVALAERTELTPKDCLAVARLLVARRKQNEALQWVERGIALDREIEVRSTGAYDLDQLHRELLTRLGREDEALEAVWADYLKYPSKCGYDDLMKFVPRAERRAWHEKAMDAAKGGDLHSLFELFIETKETERLAALVGGTTDEALEQASHYATEPAAKKLEKTHPALAARLWRAQGMRIVNAGKSKYYDAALANFERTRACYRRAGLDTDWEETVRLVRASHHRKTGFMSGFDALTTGGKRSDQPSFLERAKARWGERHGEGDS